MCLSSCYHSSKLSLDNAPEGPWPLSLPATSLDYINFFILALGVDFVLLEPSGLPLDFLYFIYPLAPLTTSILQHSLSSRLLFRLLSEFA